MIGRERGVTSARSQPLAGAAAHAGTPKIETMTSKPPPACCCEATARRMSRMPENAAHGGWPRWQPSSGIVQFGGCAGSGWIRAQSTVSRK